jgi:glutamate racemase
LLAETIKKVAGSKIKLISSAEETASQLKEFLTISGLLRQDMEPPIYRFISSGEVEAFKQLGVRFLGRDIEKVEKYEPLVVKRVIELGQD